MLIVNKAILLDAFMRMAETKLMNKDYLLVKLQGLVTDEDITDVEAQPIIDVLYSPVE